MLAQVLLFLPTRVRRVRPKVLKQVIRKNTQYDGVEAELGLDPFFPRIDERMDALCVMAAGMAHDLNNVMGPLIGYPEIILSDLPEDSPVRESLLEMLKATDRATEMIRDLVTFSRPEPFMAESVDLNVLIERNLEDPTFLKFRSILPEITIHKELDHAVYRVAGARELIAKGVSNLIRFAAEMARGEAVVRLRTGNIFLEEPPEYQNGLGKGPYVFFDALLEGKSLTQEQIEHLMEPFYAKRILGLTNFGLSLPVLCGVVRSTKGYFGVQAGHESLHLIMYLPACTERLYDSL